MEKKVRQLVDDIQHKRCTEVRAIELWKRIYNSANHEEFTELFGLVLKVLIPQDYNNPYLKNVIEVMAKFIAEMTSKEIQGPSYSSPVNLLLREVIAQIIKYHCEPNENYKLNVCSFISTTLQNIDKNVEVNANVIELVQEAMLENLLDAKTSIRIQAVLALSSIQYPNNLDCPVVKILVTCLLNQNPSVRREVVRIIGLNPISFPQIYKRTRDNDASVRRAAYSRMADIEPRHLKITQRQYILKSGFRDPSASAKKIFLELLIPKWLTAYGGNYLNFLKGIKLDADEVDIKETEKLSTQIMELFFKTQPLRKLIETLPLNDEKVISENNLKSEVVLYWNIVVKYLRQSDELEEYVEQILPELKLFCDYIHRIIDNIFPEMLQETFEENLSFQHMLCHIFDIAENYDLSEQVGRKALDKLIKKCLKEYQWHHILLNKLIRIGSKLSPKLELFTNDVYNIIFDMWQPFKESLNQTQNSREYEFKIAQLKVKLSRLENELSFAIASNNNKMSQKVEMEFNENREKLENLLKEGPPLEMVRTVTEDPAKLCWCLDLLCAILMAYANYESLPHSLIMCREDFLLPLIMDKRIEIVVRVLKCLGIYCIFDEESAKIHHCLGTFKYHIIKYKLGQKYHRRLLINCISLTCDLIMMHGVDWLDKNEETDLVESGVVEELSAVGRKLTLDGFIGVLLKMLKDEDYEIRDLSVTVFAKLMNCGLPINSVAISRLILKWFKSSGKSSSARALQQKIGMIIRAYVHSGNAAKKNVITAIVPVLTVIANASQNSSLAVVNIDNAVQFLAIISDCDNSKGLMNFHSDLARILIEEISLRPAQNVTIYFAKMLNMLNITSDQSAEMKDMIAAAELILEKETLGKAVIQHLTKFIKKLKNGNNGSAISSSMTFNSTKTSVNRKRGPSKQMDKLSPVIGGIRNEDPKYNGLSKKSEIRFEANVRPKESTEIKKEMSNQNISTSESDIIESSQPNPPPCNKILKVNLSPLPSINTRDVTNSDTATAPKKFKSSRSQKGGTKWSPDSDTASPPAKCPRLRVQNVGTEWCSDSDTASPPAEMPRLRVQTDGTGWYSDSDTASPPAKMPRLRVQTDGTGWCSDSDTASPPAKMPRLRVQTGGTKWSLDSDTASTPAKCPRLRVQNGKMPGSPLSENTDDYANMILRVHISRLPEDTLRALEEINVPHSPSEDISVFPAESAGIGPIAPENFGEGEKFSSWSSVEEIEDHLRKTRVSREEVGENAQTPLVEKVESSIASPAITISDDDEEKNTQTSYSPMISCKKENCQSAQSSSTNTMLEISEHASALGEIDVPYPVSGATGKSSTPSPRDAEKKLIRRISSTSLFFSEGDFQNYVQNLGPKNSHKATCLELRQGDVRKSPEKLSLSQAKASSNGSSLAKSEDTGIEVQENFVKNEVFSSWSSVEEIEREFKKSKSSEKDVGKKAETNLKNYEPFGKTTLLSPEDVGENAQRPLVKKIESEESDISISDYHDENSTHSRYSSEKSNMSSRTGEKRQISQNTSDAMSDISKSSSALGETHLPHPASETNIVFSDGKLRTPSPRDVSEHAQENLQKHNSFTDSSSLLFEKESGNYIQNLGEKKSCRESCISLRQGSYNVQLSLSEEENFSSESDLSVTEEAGTKAQENSVRTKELSPLSFGEEVDRKLKANKSSKADGGKNAKTNSRKEDPLISGDVGEIAQRSSAQSVVWISDEDSEKNTQGKYFSVKSNVSSRSEESSKIGENNHSANTKLDKSKTSSGSSRPEEATQSISISTSADSSSSSIPTYQGGPRPKKRRKLRERSSTTKFLDVIDIDSDD